MKKTTIKNLETSVPWTQTFESLVSTITWEPKIALGVSKAEMLKDYEAFFKDRFKAELTGVEIKQPKDLNAAFASFLKKNEKYVPTPDQRTDLALKKEEFFNKEFDLFMHLTPNEYLTYLYSEMGFGTYSSKNWYRFGNSHHFNKAFQELNMQMDNIIYCADQKTLFCNELKISAKKNEDQITKYVHMFHKLMEHEAIPNDSKLNLCFISLNPESYNKNDMDIEFKKIKQLQDKNKARWFTENFHQFALNLKESERFAISCTTWDNLIRWNQKYLLKYPINNSPAHETLHRLFNGFNETYDSRYKDLAKAA